jgi:cytochrome c oxidase subunit III
MSVPSTKKHSFHIIEPSPWPILASFAAGLLATGAILQMHKKGWYLLALGLIALIAVAFAWWRDVIKEARVDQAHTSVVQRGLRMGMLWFIVTEIAFFGSFFWAYFHVSLIPGAGTQFKWPPAGIQTFDPFELPFFNTLLLLLSGTTVTWAHQALFDHKNRDMVKALGLTVLLGFIFTCVQAFEYAHATFKFTDGIYASTFYMATGFHGFHVIIGTLFLFVCWFRANKNEFTIKGHIGFEAAAWYWHFVDVVWLFLFVSIYWYGRGPGVAS